MGDFRFTKLQLEILKDLKYGLSNKYKEICLFGGRRSGKTFILLEILFQRALSAPASKHIICRSNYSTIKASIWDDTIQNQLMQIEKYANLLNRKCILNKKDLSITFPNQSVIYLKGLDSTEKGLGTEFSTIYFNECSDIKYQKLELASGLASKRNIVIDGKVIGKLPTLKFYDFNPPYKSHWTYKYFFENINIDTGCSREKEAIDATYIRQLNPVDNQDNIDSDYIKELKSKGDAYYKRFCLGEFLEDNLNAVFKYDQIQQGKDHNLHGLSVTALKKATGMYKIVIGVDPAVSINENSDLTGIVVCGYANDGFYYILEDKSGKYTPKQVGVTIIGLCKKWGTGEVVIEVNQGGSYLKENLMVTKEKYKTSITLNIREVRGNNYKEYDSADLHTNPKLKRAEAVRGLYDLQQIRQIDYYNDGIEDKDRLAPLNTEMLNYDGTGKSPDRMDAMVYAIIDLLQNKYANDSITSLNKYLADDSIVADFTRQLCERGGGDILF